MSINTKFVSVFSGKGGVGKSLLTILLADYLSSAKLGNKNFKILILDMDDQCSSATATLTEENVIEMGDRKESLPDVIEKLDNYSAVEDLIPKLTKKRIIRPDRSQKTKLGPVDVIHSVNETGIVKYLKNSTPQKSKRIAKNLKRFLSTEYDIVLIDLPGSNIPNDYSLIGLLLAENFFLPTTCSALEVFSFPKTFENLDRVKKIKGNDFQHKVHKVIRNMVDLRTKTWTRRRNEIKRICSDNGLGGEPFYEQPLTFNPSLMNAGLYDGQILMDKWNTMYDKSRKLAISILKDLGFNKLK